MLHVHGGCVHLLKHGADVSQHLIGGLVLPGDLALSVGLEGKDGDVVVLIQDTGQLGGGVALPGDHVGQAVNLVAGGPRPCEHPETWPAIREARISCTE